VRREGREREKGTEGIGDRVWGEGEWGSPTHYFRFKSCTAIRYCADQTYQVVWPRGPGGQVWRSSTRALQACISPAPRKWRWRPSRPRHIWLRTVEEDLRQFNLGLDRVRAPESTKQNNLADTHRNSNVTDMIRLIMILIFKNKNYKTIN